MKSNTDIKELALNVIKSEYEAIKSLSDYVDSDFSEVVKLIYESKGRVIVTGIGKSAIIGEKIVATFNSTGTPAVFMHAADALHGDLGIVRPDDVVLCLSKSGNTPEIKVLIPYIKMFGNKIIALLSEADSFLGKQADFVIKATVEKEACPNNLAPTSSSTAQLVMGDALAVCLLEYRSFGNQDFARFHPGGALGRKLYMRVSDLYLKNERPKVKPDAGWSEVIIEISEKRLGATAVVDDENKLLGIITDGDLRRMLQNGLPDNTQKASEIMSKNPKTVQADELAVNAFQEMKKRNITQLIVSDENTGNYLGIIHLHDILREGII